MGYTSNLTEGHQKCVIAKMASIAVVVRAEHAKLFVKVTDAVARCQNILIIGICLATIFGILVYITGNNDKFYFLNN